MLSLSNKQIILGVTGGIAAYKAAELCRLLIKAGADVRVVMTPSAAEFITSLTFQALSGNRVHIELLDEEAEAAMGHIELARWADLVLIAPASANFIARLSQGRAEDLLSTLCLATNAPIAVAPAMNQAMWRNQNTQDNLQQLKQKNITVLGPASGEQACGDVGLGRMLEPEEISTGCSSMFETGELAGVNITITAGPTREAIDPVRYISNHSSGKMGYALARAAMEAGAKVVLVSGPVALEPPPKSNWLRWKAPDKCLMPARLFRETSSSVLLQWLITARPTVPVKKSRKMPTPWSLAWSKIRISLPRFPCRPSVLFVSASLRKPKISKNMPAKNCRTRNLISSLPIMLLTRLTANLLSPRPTGRR